MSKIKSVAQFYNGSGRLGIHSLWMERADVGDAIVPSAYDDKYVPHLLRFSSKHIINKNLISIGSGCGIAEAAIKKSGAVSNIIATDLFESACKLCSDNGLQAVCCDAASMPFEDERFGAVLFDGVLGHVHASGSHPKVISEIRRITLRNSPIIICDDASDESSVASNPRVKLTRFSDEYFHEFIAGLGGSIVDESHFFYKKGSEGTIRRRLSVVYFY